MDQPKPKREGPPRWIPVATGLLLGLVIGLAYVLFQILAGRWGPQPRPEDTGGSSMVQVLDDPIDRSRRNAIVTAIERTKPSVVTISAAGPRPVRRPFSELFALPFRFQPQVNVQWVGSGFLIDEAGYVITTEHVVRGATNLVVSLSNGMSAHATLVGTAPRFDLALLHVDASSQSAAQPGFPQVQESPPLQAAELGDSERLQVGEWTIAIGSPFGYELNDPQPSVSLGVLSAIGRDIRPPSSQAGIWPYFNLLQTDAAINRGNSGGPLVNSLGQVIGVNLALVSSNTGQTNLGINFSIPINTVKWVFEELRNYGEVRRPWVGWYLGEAVSATARSQMGLAETQGQLLVEGVIPNSPVDEAGIEVGDYIMYINDQVPYSLSRAERILFETRVGGDPIKVVILKASDGQFHTVMVDVLENPREQQRRRQRRQRPFG